MKNSVTRILVLLAAILTGLCALVLPAIKTARDAAMQMSCSNHLKQIGLALVNYEESYRQLPKAVQVSNDGKLWRSWRSCIYPTFMVALAPIYDASSAWDSETNLRLINGAPISIARKDGGTVLVALDRVPQVFVCPKCKNPSGVSYVVITGEGTAFPESMPVKLVDIADGLENTLLVVESVNCNPDWTEPRDLDIDTMQFEINSEKGPSISSLHARGALACFADMAIYCITPRITEAELRALISIDGRENVTRDDLVLRGVLIEQ